MATSPKPGTSKTNHPRETHAWDLASGIFLDSSQTTDPESEQIFYLFDWGDGSSSGWLGPYNSGVTGVGSHIWDELGTYSVKVKARDIWGAGSSWSDSIMVTITDNTPPTVPEVTGPAEGKPNKPFLFNMMSTDAQDQTISYYVDWGDGTITDWVSNTPSMKLPHLENCAASAVCYATE